MDAHRSRDRARVRADVRPPVTLWHYRGWFESCGWEDTFTADRETALVVNLARRLHDAAPQPCSNRDLRVEILENAS